MQITVMISITIILPINFTMGNIQGDKTSFGQICGAVAVSQRQLKTYSPLVIPLGTFTKSLLNFVFPFPLPSLLARGLHALPGGLVPSVMSSLNSFLHSEPRFLFPTSLVSV